MMWLAARGAERSHETSAVHTERRWPDCLLRTAAGDGRLTWRRRKWLP